MTQQCEKTRIGPIDEIIVDGFQSLVDVKMRLSPGVNVVVGESDVGKSALIRALQAIVSNQRGDGFVNNRTGKCRVVVKADGDTVVWRKPENEYQLNDDEPFRKVGVAVPDEVLAAVNMQPLELDPNNARSINIVGQDDPKFLVRDKETDVAKTIGAVTRLQQVYNAMRCVASDRRSASSESKTLDVEATQLRLKLATFSDLPREAERLTRLETIFKSCREMSVKLDALTALSVKLASNADEAVAVAVEMRRIDAILGATESVKLAAAALKNIEELQRMQNSLTTVSDDLTRIERSIAAVIPVSEIRVAEIESIASTLSSVSVCGDRLATNKLETVEITERVAELDKIAVVDTSAIEQNVRMLGQYVAASAAIVACDDAVATITAEEAALDERIAGLVSEVDTLLQEVAVCPLSGGMLYDDCKQLLGES